jgi:hypothetical protein
MSYNITPPLPTATEREITKQCTENDLILNHYTVTRIVYEVIKLYMMNNPPESVGVKLAQKYDVDYTKSGILLDVGYNWRTKDMSKVPAIFVQRGDVSLKGMTIGEAIAGNPKTGGETRNVFSHMPVMVTCVAAEPIAVVENLAEYIKQPLLYFRRTIQADFGIRHFLLEKITAPKLLAEGKNNFFVDLVLNITFDDNWTIQRNSLILKRVGIELFDNVMEAIQRAEI